MKEVLQTLRHALKAALRFLKTQHIKQWHYRYKLPWYLVIGAHNAGKTSLLINNDIPLVNINNETPQVTQATHHCQWLFSSQAVFLDMGEHSDDAIWAKWFKILKRHRRHCPINGVIVTINPHAWESRVHQQQQLHTIHSCLQALYHIAPQTPIYIAFTHSDLILGFKEFFEDLGTEERSQLCGITFTEKAENQQLLTDFNVQFDDLIKRLNTRVIWRLHQERYPEKCALIKNFPLQLASLKVRCREFIEQLNQQLSLNLRGFYFTSSAQQGEPIDYLQQSFGQTFVIANTASTILPAERKAFFTTDLINKAILAYKDDYLHYKDNSPLRKNSYSIIACTMLLLFTVWYTGYQQNINAINKAKLALAEINLVDPNNPLPALNALQNSMTALSNAHSRWYAYLGLLPPAKLQSSIIHTYQHVLQTDFLPELTYVLETQLQSMNSQNLTDLYGVLKTYLMLGNIQLRNDRFIQNWFNQYWQKTLPNDSQQQVELNNHLTALLKMQRTIQIKPELVTKSRTILQQTALPQLALMILQNQSAEAPITFSTTTYRISAIFTAKNFPDIYNRAIVEACRNLGKGDWVLGNLYHPVITSGEMRQLITTLRIIYLQEYASTWLQFLASNNFSNVNNLPQIARIASILVNHDSSLFRLLTLIRNNTAPLNNAIAFNQQVSQPFASLNLFTENWQKSSLAKNLKDFDAYFSIVTSTHNYDAAAFAAAKMRMENNGVNDPISNLANVAKQLPEPLSNWFITLTNNSWQILLQNARNYLNQKWLSEVLPEYNQYLLNRYPLFLDASADIPLADFSRFFGPKGTLSVFFNNYLRAFVNTNDSTWEWKQLAGKSLNIPEKTLEMFVRGSLIQKMFFHNNNQPSINFSLAAVDLEPGVANFALQIDGQLIQYQPNPKEIYHLVWPGPAANYTTMRFTTKKGKTETTIQTGPWAWFKLLTKTNIVTDGNTKALTLIFDLNGNAAKYKLLSNEDTNPFIPGIIDAFRCPEML